MVAIPVRTPKWQARPNLRGLAESLTVAQYQVWHGADFFSHRRAPPALLEKTENQERKEKQWDCELQPAVATVILENSKLLQPLGTRHLHCRSRHLRLRCTELLTVGFR